MDIWLKDPDDNEPSITISLFVLGFVIAAIKLLLSGCTIGVFSMSQFSGVDFAAVVGALGTVYAARKHSDNMNK